MAIDPGTTASAWCVMSDGGPVGHGKATNLDVLQGIVAGKPGRRVLVIEQVEAMGMSVGREVFETVFWSGRFAQAARALDLTVARITRRQEKLELCGTSRAKDANIRQALIDRYGGKVAAIGNKAAPGPLYGFRTDEWAALAVAETYGILVARGEQPELVP